MVSVRGAFIWVSLLVVVAVFCQCSSQQEPPKVPNADNKNNNDNNKPEPLDEGVFNVFPNAIECDAQTEEPAPGKLQECEPTCANPRPTCLKIFHVGLDFVPCFCRRPLVRDPISKRCIERTQC